MTPIEIASALLCIASDTFLAEVYGGWLYEAEVHPPVAELGFAVGPDVVVSLVSPAGVETTVYVYKPRPLSPTPTMCTVGKAGKPPMPLEAFPNWLIDVLRSVAYATSPCAEPLVAAV